MKLQPHNPYSNIGLGVSAYRDVRPAYPELVLEQLSITEDTKIADIGAGTGKLTAQLATRCTDLWAVEPAVDMREGFCQELPDFLPQRLITGKAEETHLPANYFDLLTYGQCWHWLNEKNAAAEAARILRGNGTIAVLFNQFDVSVPWVLQLSRIMRSGDVHRFDRPPEFGKNFTKPLLFHTTWHDTLTVEEMILLGTTRSSWIKSDSDNRSRMSANLRWYLTEELEHDQDHPIKLPYHTYLWQAKKKA